MAFFNKKQAKEKRKGENLVGKIIYCFLLFAPLLSILGTSAYTIFNKNAYQSYSDINAVSYTNTNTQNQVVGMTYQVRYNENGTTNAYQYLNVLDGKTNVNEIYLTEPYKSKTIDRLTIESNGNALYCYFTDSTYYGITNWYNTSRVFNYVAATTNQIADFTTRYYQIYRMDYTTAKLDNSFEYATEKVENSSLYNWAKNTGTYTVMHQTTQGLGIENTFIPMLMSYWLLISVIYFIYDIALILIWALHRRIHDLGDSI